LKGIDSYKGSVPFLWSRVKKVWVALLKGIVVSFGAITQNYAGVEHNRAELNAKSNDELAVFSGGAAS